jgi:hypothetical protein
MIDYDRFWADPDCLPGMTRDQTEKALREQLGEMFEAYMAKRQPGPGVTPAQIKAWESQRRVRLPEVLRQALARQDGGHVRGTFFRILPLAEIGPVEDGEFWEFACYEEEEISDRRLVFQFAEDEDLSGSFYLHFARGPQQEPGVYEYHSDPGDLSKCSGSVSKFFDRMLKSDEAPSVDSSEAKRLPVVAEETIDLSPLHHQPAAREQILARQGQTLILFTHERTPYAETFTRTVLPLPLEERIAWVQPFRPEPLRTYSLTLQPVNRDGIMQLESKWTGDGRWKNAKSEGVPVCVLFESADKARLEVLRREVLGEQAAGRAQAQDQRRDQLQETMGGHSPQEQQAAHMQMLLQMMGQRPSMPPETLENMPREAADLQALLQQRMQAAMERARDLLAKYPLSPEMQRLLEQAARPPDETRRDG